MTAAQTRPVLDTLGMQLTKSIDAKFAGMYSARVSFRHKKATFDRSTAAAAKHAHCCASPRRCTAVRAFMFGSKTHTAEIERFLQRGFLLGRRLERTVATDCRHAQRTCKDATQEDVHFVLREVFEKWTHARVQVPVAQRMAATLKWGGKPTHETHARTTATSGRNKLPVELESSRGLGSVAEIFVRTMLGKTVTVAIGSVLTTDDLRKRIGVKVNLSSSGHGLEPSCVVGPETTALNHCVLLDLKPHTWRNQAIPKMSNKTFVLALRSPRGAFAHISAQSPILLPVHAVQSRIHPKPR